MEWKMALNRVSSSASAFHSCEVRKIQTADGAFIRVLRAGRSLPAGQFGLYCSARGRKFPTPQFVVFNLFETHNWPTVPGPSYAQKELAAG
jgi:hypothetical protein